MFSSAIATNHNRSLESNAKELCRAGVVALLHPKDSAFGSIVFLIFCACPNEELLTLFLFLISFPFSRYYFSQL